LENLQFDTVTDDDYATQKASQEDCHNFYVYYLVTASLEILLLT